MITADRYAVLTGDSTSVEADVETAIDDATALLVEYLGRGLAYGEHVESLVPDRDGRLWPRVTPVDVAEGWTIDGLALLGTRLAWFWGEETVEVTYTGGWADAREATPEGPDLPTVLQRDIAMAAYRLLHPTISTLNQITPGATSVRLGDAAVTGSNLGAADSTDAWWSRRTRGYRYAPIGTRTPTAGAVV